MAAAPERAAQAEQETCVSRAPDQETRVAHPPSERRRLARGTQSEAETQVTPHPSASAHRRTTESEKETRVESAPAHRRTTESEKETRVESAPERARRRSAQRKDGATMSLRGQRWSQRRPTTGVRERPRRTRLQTSTAPGDLISSAARPSESPRSRRGRDTRPAVAAETLNLPVSILVLERMKLCPTTASITDISRAAAFVACSLQPLPGRRLVMRVASDVGVGVAVGYVQATFERAGFAVRINASTEGFRAYVDALRGFDRGDSPEPALSEPVSMQIL